MSTSILRVSGLDQFLISNPTHCMSTALYLYAVEYYLRNVKDASGSLKYVEFLQFIDWS